MRRKRISKTGLGDEARGESTGDLPRPRVGAPGAPPARTDEARRALEQEDLLAGYARPVVHDLSVPGLDPPPVPIDSDPDLPLLGQERSTFEGLPPVAREAATRSKARPAQPAAVRPSPLRRARKGPLEVSVPTAGLERRITDGDAAIMVFVPEEPVRDEEPRAERIGGGHHRRTRATVPVSPTERPRVRRPTASHGSARAAPERPSRGRALGWVLFVIGLTVAATLYLVLTR